MAEPLTEAEVRDFVNDWYQKLDVHAPTDEVMPLVAKEDEGLEMKFPGEATVRKPDDFKGMLDTWYHRFFDEVHTVKELDISTEGDGAHVKLCVNWQAKIWAAPAPKSQCLGFDAYQTWVVGRSKTSGRPVIVRYVVDKLDPMPGSASL
jgi:hypothetical protein